MPSFPVFPFPLNTLSHNKEHLESTSVKEKKKETRDSPYHHIKFFNVTDVIKGSMKLKMQTIFVYAKKLD